MSNQQRRRQAEKILENPSHFKICEGCDSIVVKRVAICPGCDSYRFDEAEARVVEQAKILSNKEQTSVLASDLLS